MVVLCNEESIPLIVTSAFVVIVSPVVLTPDPLTTRPPASAIDTIVPIPSPGSGLVSGNESLSTIGTKPPASFSKFTT